MFDYHVPPESTDQRDRITARVLFADVLSETPDTPPNKEFIDAILTALEDLRPSGYPGVDLITVGSLAWAGTPPGVQDQERALQRVSTRVPAVNRAVTAIKERAKPKNVNRRGRRRATQ